MAMNEQLSQSLVEAEETIERLKRELEFARQEAQRTKQEAHEKEQSHLHLEIESQARKNDLNHLRIQAEEVAKRRKLEKELFRLKEELQQACQEKDRHRLDLTQIKQQLIEEREKTLIEAQEEIANIRAQAKDAWRHAEDEISRLDSDAAKLNQLLESEKNRRNQAEQTISKLESTIARMRQNESDSQMDHLDKIHFDKLLKKAHLAIKTLQEKLSRSSSDRDSYLKELSQIRAQLIERNLEDILKEPPATKEQHSANTEGKQDKASKAGKVHDKVSYFKNTLNKKHPEGLKSLPSADSEQIDLSQPLFGDDFSDELLLIEPDMSFGNIGDEQRTASDSDNNTSHATGAQSPSSAVADSAANTVVSSITKNKTPKPKGRATDAKVPPEPIYDEYDTSDKAISELARELLQGTNSLNKPTAQGKYSFNQDANALDGRSRKGWRGRIERPRIRFRKVILSLLVICILSAAAIGAWYGISNYDFGPRNARLLKSPTYQQLQQDRLASESGSVDTKPAVAAAPSATAPATASTPASANQAKPLDAASREQAVPVTTATALPALASPSQPAETATSDTTDSVEFKAQPIPATTTTEGAPKNAAEPPRTSPSTAPAAAPAAPATASSVASSTAPSTAPTSAAQEAPTQSAAAVASSPSSRSPASLAEEARLRTVAETELRATIMRSDPVQQLLVE